MSVVAGVFGALPPHRYSQRELTDFFVSIPEFADYEDIVRQLHAIAKIHSGLSTASLSLCSRICWAPTASCCGTKIKPSAS